MKIPNYILPFLSLLSSAAYCSPVFFQPVPIPDYSSANNMYNQSADRMQQALGGLSNTLANIEAQRAQNKANQDEADRREAYYNELRARNEAERNRAEQQAAYYRELRAKAAKEEQDKADRAAKEEPDKANRVHLVNQATQGDAEAQFILGQMYGEEENYTLSKKWYEKAANQGNSMAQFNLGVMYYWGDGVAKNYALAKQWYKKAANQGDSMAQFNLGKMYYTGEGGAKNYALAKQWYEKAAAQGNADAQSAIDQKYSDGNVQQ